MKLKEENTKYKYNFFKNFNKYYNIAQSFI